jgi:hypothetical protein
MLRHQLGQNLFLGSGFSSQIGDRLLVGGVVGWAFLLDGGRPVLEELFLPAAEDRRLKANLIIELETRCCSRKCRLEWRPSHPAFSASVASSCVLSVILTAERSLHFQLLRRDRPKRKRNCRASWIRRYSS